MGVVDYQEGYLGVKLTTITPVAILLVLIMLKFGTLCCWLLVYCSDDSGLRLSLFDWTLASGF